MTENERLKYLQKILNFSSQEKFALKLGIKQGSLSDVYRSKKNVKVSSSIKRILEKEYSINIDWLETGEGEVFQQNINTSLIQSRDPRDIEVIELQSKQIALLEENVMSLKDNITSLRDINNLLREKISSLEVGLANAHMEDKSDVAVRKIRQQEVPVKL